MYRRKQRSAFDKLFEFDRGRIVAYQNRLSFWAKPNNCNAGMKPLGARGYEEPTWFITSPQCTTSRDEQKIVRMAVTVRSVTSRTVAQHIESVTHLSVCAYHSTPFTVEWSVRKTSIAWYALDAEPQMSPPPMVRLMKNVSDIME
ncbi:uncharacterized protein TNCV_2783101 [Trichonephila clavipes]|nr:uncharacterized protein TNCV_2783101 [Trichonephila clavipes]